MEKYLRVQMSDGVMYDIPADIIAEHRASWFETNSAEKFTYHASSLPARTIATEKEFTLNNDEILIDWASNYMEWNLIKRHAKKVEGPEKDYETDWKQTKKEVIEY